MEGLRFFWLVVLVWHSTYFGGSMQKKKKKTKKKNCLFGILNIIRVIKGHLGSRDFLFL